MLGVSGPLPNIGADQGKQTRRCANAVAGYQMADGLDPAAHSGVRFTACRSSQLLGGQLRGDDARRTPPDHSQVN
jgi:hypothetical protein